VISDKKGEFKKQ